MRRIESVQIALGSDHAEWFLHALRESAPEVDAAAAGSRSADEGVNFDSAAGDIAVIAIAGAGLVQQLAPILVEYFRTKRRSLRIRQRDGSSIEIGGAFHQDEVEQLLDKVISDPPAPPDQG